jgi:hypothetical protein
MQIGHFTGLAGRLLAWTPSLLAGEEPEHQATATNAGIR